MEPTPKSFDVQIGEECQAFAAELRRKYPEVRGVLIGIGYDKRFKGVDLLRNILHVGNERGIDAIDASVAIDIAHVMMDTSIHLYKKTVTDMVDESKLIMLRTAQLHKEVVHGPARQTPQGTTHEEEQDQEAGVPPAGAKGEAQGPAQAAGD